MEVRDDRAEILHRDTRQTENNKGETRKVEKRERDRKKCT